MAEAQERSAERPKVFISYPRADASTLAEELVLSLPVAERSWMVNHPEGGSPFVVDVLQLAEELRNDINAADGLC